MKVFVAAVSSETQHVGSLSSVFELQRRNGDELFIEYRTRGDVARESLLEEFLKRKEFDAVLMLDADQRHPRDMLEKLRAHDLDMVCAHYYRRETHPVQSLCYELTGDESYPFLPLLQPPTEGLHEIAVTGLGCVLIQRRVLEAVKATLPKGESPFAIGTLPSESKDYGNWGSDFRFFVMARRLGFKLWLDAGIESLHAVTLWLGHKSAQKLTDYTAWADAAMPLFRERLELHGVNLEAVRQRQRINEARLQGLLQQADEIGRLRAQALDDEKRLAELYEKAQEISIAVYEMQGRIKENNAWLEWMEKYPPITTPAQLPTTQNTPAQNHDEGATVDEVKETRREMYRQQAADIVAELPELKGNGRR